MFNNNTAYMLAIEAASRDLWNKNVHTLPSYMLNSGEGRRSGWLNATVCSKEWWKLRSNWLYTEHGIQTSGYNSGNADGGTNFVKVVDKDKALLFKLKYYGTSDD